MAIVCSLAIALSASCLYLAYRCGCLPATKENPTEASTSPKQVLDSAKWQPVTYDDLGSPSDFETRFVGRYEIYAAGLKRGPFYIDYVVWRFRGQDSASRSLDSIAEWAPHGPELPIGDEGYRIWSEDERGYIFRVGRFLALCLYCEREDAEELAQALST